MPGLKPTQAPAERAPPARKRRVRGTPTDMVVRALARCPACGQGLAGGTPSRTRQVIELKPRLAEVAEHVLVERVCPRCQRCWRPRADLARAVAGSQRLRIGPMVLIATLREPGGCCSARSVGTWSRGVRRRSPHIERTFYNPRGPRTRSGVSRWYESRQNPTRPDRP